MALVTITHGVVSVEDGRKSNIEYEPPRKARVELSFDVAEGADARKAIDHVSLLAHAQVRSLLHQTAEPIERAEKALEAAQGPALIALPRAATPAPSEPPADAGVNDPADVDARPTTRRRGRPPKSAPSATSDSGTAASATNVSTASAVETPGPQSTLQLTRGGDPAAIDDDVLTAADPISDADLQSEIQKRNGVINNTPAIRDLIGSYSQGKRPFFAALIPQSDRADFLAKLAELPNTAVNL